jgi:hypothetical protein
VGTKRDVDVRATRADQHLTNALNRRWHRLTSALVRLFTPAQRKAFRLGDKHYRTDDARHRPRSP